MHLLKRLLLTQLTPLAFIQFTPKSLFNKMMKTVTQWFKFHFINHLINEGELSTQLSFFQTDTALLHIEQRSIIQLAYR